jgi:hypothetical protein
MIFTVNGNKADFSNVTTERRAYMEYTFPELVDPRFNLWVGGVKVNKLNKDDVLGNRIVSYDPETKTLSLKSGASIHGQGRATDAATGYGAGIYSEVDGLTIDVAKGGVEVIGADDCHGIYLRGKTTIKGEGTISGKGYIGVFMGSNSADLTVDGNVMLQAEGTTSLGLGGYVRGFAGKIYYYTTLTIKGTSRVLANGVLKSIGDWKDLVLEDNHAITSPTGAVWNADKHAVCDASGNPIAGEWVLITTKIANPADVNKDGTPEMIMGYPEWAAEATDNIYTPFEIYAFDGTSAVPLTKGFVKDFDYLSIAPDGMLWTHRGNGGDPIIETYSLPQGGSEVEYLGDLNIMEDDMPKQVDDLEYTSITDSVNITEN